MQKSEFATWMSRLTSTTGKKFLPHEVQFWAEGLRDLPDEAIRVAFTRFICEGDDWPSVGKLRKLAVEHEHGQLLTSGEAWAEVLRLVSKYGFYDREKAKAALDPLTIKAVVDCVQPTPDDRICDLAAGTGGFLLSAIQYVIDNYGTELDKDQKKHLQRNFVHGWELVPNTARLCIMNLYLHGINADPCPIHSGVDSLASDPGERFSVVITNPPFGKKSSIAIVNEEGQLEKEDTAYERQDFWTSTKNKQLNFIQHVKTLLKINGRCAIVVPDNVLFEGGAGESVRRNLMKQFEVHTLLRLPTGIFYAQGP